MMRKLFSKKTMKVYIVFICVSLIFGLAASGFGIYFSSRYTKATATEDSGSSSTLTSVISSAVSALTGSDDSSDSESTSVVSTLISSVVSSLIGSSDESEAEESIELTEEAQQLYYGKLVSIILMIVMFTFTLIFSAAAIASYQYEKYLDSPKYKAKLKRMKRYEKYNKSINR